VNLRFEEHGSLCVVEVRGELVGDSVDAFTRGCLERLEAGARRFIVDLAEVVLVDSRGLEAMLDLADEATERRGRCVLAAPDAGVRSILEITRLHERIEIHAAVEAAARVLH
jgi:anti-sigma B factor antagonist